MKKTGKILIAVLLIAVLAVTAIASTGSKKAELFYRDIKLTLNGQSITPKDADGNVVEPFIIDGTTYLPVRAVSGALGLNVEWDSETSTVKLTEKGYADASKYSRTNPAPVGTPQTFAYADYSEEYTATAVVKSVERGDAAWNKIKAANMFNDAPDDGKEYILAEIEVTLVSSKNDSAVSFSEYSFTAFSATNAEYSRKSVVEPDPSLQGKVFPGGTSTGYCVFMVDQNDSGPKIVIGADYRGEGGVWFSLR